MCNEVHYEPGRENIKQTASLMMQLFASVSLKLRADIATIILRFMIQSPITEVKLLNTVTKMS